MMLKCMMENDRIADYLNTIEYTEWVVVVETNTVKRSKTAKIYKNTKKKKIIIILKKKMTL